MAQEEVKDLTLERKIRCVAAIRAAAKLLEETTEVELVKDIIQAMREGADFIQRSIHA